MSDPSTTPRDRSQPGARCLRALGVDRAALASLTALGRPGRPARVVRVDRDRVAVADGQRTLRTDPDNSLVDDPDTGSPGLPVVGDWVLISDHDPPTVLALAPRRGRLMRRDPGDPPRPQLLAAGVDIVFITVPADRSPNVARLERELVTAFAADAEPVVILTKLDCVADASGLSDALAPATGGLDVVGTQIPEQPVREPRGADHPPSGLDEIRAMLAPGRTGVLLGPSGAGKSTLANAIVGETVRAVGAVRPGDRKGRHTTASRALVTVPTGGVLIDTPGLRALGLWDAELGLARTFAEITAAAAHCRFLDCTHRHEPGCAVRSAVEAGDIGADRLERYHVLDEELVATEEARSLAERNRRRRADRGGR